MECILQVKSKMGEEFRLILIKQKQENSDTYYYTHGIAILWSTEKMEETNFLKKQILRVKIYT